jgi:hypothetical protein
MLSTISLIFNISTHTKLIACKKWGEHVLNIIGIDSCVIREKQLLLY